MSGPCRISRFNLYSGIFWIAVAMVLGAVWISLGHAWEAVPFLIPLTVGACQIAVYVDQAHMAREIIEGRP